MKNKKHINKCKDSDEEYKDVQPVTKRYLVKKKQKKIEKLKLFGKCSICLEKIKAQITAYFLPCCHFFHKNCIDTWVNINVTCPECRIPVFIQTNVQMEAYKIYLTKQKNNYDLVRQNLSTNDTAISLMFMRNPDLFNMEELEDNDSEKFRALYELEDPSFMDLYGSLFTDEDSLSSIIKSIPCKVFY